VEKIPILESRGKSDGAAYTSKKKVNRLRKKTTRKSAMKLYLFVALWGSKTANWSQLFLGIYTVRDSVISEVFRAICQ
jgi:hypothetical protein